MGQACAHKEGKVPGAEVLEGAGAKPAGSAGKKFQVKLSGEWKDEAKAEDKILKRAFLAGFPNAKYTLRGQKYECSFKAGNMQQKNSDTGKSRDLRPPYNWKAPAAPITKKGPTFCISVPPGAPGTTIQVPHPKNKGEFIAVNVPKKAKVGQAMLVPIPSGPPAAIAESEISAPYKPPPDSPTAKPADAKKKKAGWSTGGKASAVAGGALVVGGLAVGGAVLGEHIAEEGWEETMAELGDMAEGAGAELDEGADAALDWVGDAADTAGDFIMDLF